MLDKITTMPGILITCGVVLLVIAIILFLLGNKKDKKVENSAPVSDVNEPIVNDTVAVEPIAVPEPVSVVTNEEPEIVAAPTDGFDFSVEEPAPVEAPSMVETEEVTIVEEPVVEPVVEEPVISIPEIDETREEL